MAEYIRKTSSVSPLKSLPVRKKPRGAVELPLCYLNLALQHTVVVRVGIVEVEVALGGEVAVPLLGGETPDVGGGGDDLGGEGEEVVVAGLEDDGLLVDDWELSRLPDIHLQLVSPLHCHK